MKKVEESSKPMKDILSPLVTWQKDRAAKFNPSENTVETQKGDIIEYDYMVVASGIETHFESIPGLLEALKVAKGPVCSIYSPLYVSRVYEAFQNFRGGNAIFTFPSSPVKCPGWLDFPSKLKNLIKYSCRRSSKDLLHF